MIALVARYHRQATPKKSHEGYGDLNGALRRTVKALSAMVRLAEGLDRSHAQALAGIDLYPARRRLSRPAPRATATRSWSSGPRTATSRRSSRVLGKPHSLRSRRQRLQGTAATC